MSSIEGANGDGGHSPGNVMASLAAMVGAPEAALRLLITIFAGYPIALIYRKLVLRDEFIWCQHLYFAFTGILLGAFNYGYETCHSLVTVVTTYTLMRLLQADMKKLLAINFLFQMTYLLVGYYFTASNEYDILWTMPQCVLVLRMIGLGFDIADGHKEREELSKDQLETALIEPPTFLELLAFAYFPCSFIVGPQFPFRRYQRFTRGQFAPYEGAVTAGMKRMLLGIIYLLVRQVGSTALPDSYFLSEKYLEEPLALRIVYMGLLGKLAIYKYISCWLITEGAMMCMGITYAGKTADGQNDWYGCCNVNLVLLETGNAMSHYVQSFNVNTNQWVSQYIYKRLKFLNNRTISYIAALAFLAVWHGFHSGYYMSFCMEYMVVTTEKQIESFYKKEVLAKYGDKLRKSLLYACLEFIALKSYNVLLIGWCLTPFIFLSYGRWMHALSAVHYYGFAYVGVWFAFQQIHKHRMLAHSPRGDHSVGTSAQSMATSATGN